MESHDMPIQIGQGADHSFDEPLGLLSDCHRRIEQFLGVPLTKIEVNPEAVGRYKTDEGAHDFDFLQDDMRELGYAGL